jgi:outer membrane translocation and assembly module TamA
MRRLTTLLLVALTMPLLWGQQDSLPKRERMIGVLPVPTFGFAPETRAYVGAVALITLRHWADSLTRTSTAGAEITYTQNKQFVAELECNLFTPGERFNIEAVAGWRKFSEYWWGMGNASPDSAKALYDARRIETDVKVTRQVRKHLFIGLRHRLQYMYGIKGEDGQPLSLLLGPGVQGSLCSGIGPSVSYDSRKSLLNAREGAYAHFSALAFQSWTGSERAFVRFELDTRKYWPLRQHKDVLAVQAYALLNPGEPPFRLMGLLGSDREMRGYYQGRYRDQHYAALQAEYRLHLVWRLGMAAFAGIGEVWGPWSSADVSTLKPSAGAGIRFLMDKKDDTNLRMDAAFGRNSFGFYVAFGESF